MMNMNTFGVSVAAAVWYPAARHATRTAIPAAAGKHRVAAATDSSVDRSPT